MIPQRRVSPQFFHINDYFSQIEVVQPDEIDYPVSDLVTEAHVRDYIYRRYLVSDDYDEMIDRWRVGSIFYWISSPELYKDFTSKEALYNLRMYRDRSLLRSVEIDWVKPLAYNLWQVQFQTVDLFPESERPQVTIWRATLRVGYFKIPFAKREEAVLNPYGFLVTGYSLAFHSNPEDQSSYMQAVKKQAEDQYR